MRHRLLFITLCVILNPMSLVGQDTPKPVPNDEITQMVDRFMGDPRGPYRDIRWFCRDGTTVAPSERCPEPGVQRARYKEEVLALARSNHVYLGQILSTTEHEAFRDQAYDNSRLKQYQLEKYLRQIDNGWVNRRAQFYRGAFQAEDEDAWGVEFLRWLLRDTDLLKERFFLVRQAVKDIPHGENKNLAQKVRTTSKEISDAYPAFIDLRVKIHGQPDDLDAERVHQFLDANSARLSPELTRKMTELIADLKSLFDTANLSSMKQRVERLPATSPVRGELLERLTALDAATDPAQRAAGIAEIAIYLRETILDETGGSSRLALLDISNSLEQVLTASLSSWSATTLGRQLARIESMTMASAGFGFLELWEYGQVSAELGRLRSEDAMSLASLTAYLDAARRLVEWGSLTVHATYEDVVTLYAGFEPLAGGFYDEKIRGSVLLPLGRDVGRLGDLVAQEAELGSKVLDIPNQAQARGLNPGYAKGPLTVVSGNPEEVEIDASHIYVFNRPPADLKPVAGILTVTEGNLVSHVQLLARNLGIPNGVVSSGNLQSLSAYDGREVFLAVSNVGTVVLKLAADMSPAERKLFEVKKRSEEKITVPVGRMDLSAASVLNLADVDATRSGIITGPKAANLGQLKKMFPQHVVDGLVIPFGIFRKHMDQTMPGSGQTYWGFLTSAFETAASMRADNIPDQDVELYILGQLEVIRGEIKRMPLLPTFEAQFRQMFGQVLGGELGTIPVFVRSDTNMEDLKDFTGAGLNLTLFNVLDAEKILQGIKDVWASPYTERSFKWRQRYLLNPENVYPSILVIPTVNADYSGVLITKGVVGGIEEDATAAFNRGVGGAVDGQAAETWLLRHTGQNILLSPARETRYTSVPPTGGTAKLYTDFSRRILTDENLRQLGSLGQTIERQLPGSPGVETKGPFDIELGFKDGKIWLFQVRPFVENKLALSSEYLQSISPTAPPGKTVPLSRTMP